MIKNYLYPIFSDQEDVNVRYKVVGLYIILIFSTVFFWLWAFYTLSGKPLLFGTAVLAYTLGLRHGVDADHIAAIDNVTRKLMQEGKKPASLGFFFSLGHSSVVIIATVCVALATSKLMHSNLTEWHSIAGTVCTSISAIFLLLIAFINLLIFISIYKIFQKVRKGGIYEAEDIDKLINNRGFFAKYFRRLFRLITKSWHMYFVGFLFGIGFDTASEIALLGIAASQTIDGVSFSTMLVFPALFTAGMTLIDTTDCIIMLGAYGWAFMKPVRKLYYNLTITFVSVIVALFIGGIEAIGLIANQVHAKGVVWNLIRDINNNFNNLGYFIILVFIASWTLSALIYRYLKIEESK